MDATLIKDAGPLTERQRQQLCEMLARAVLEMRLLGWRGEAEQVADLADAFHNLPSMLWSENFSISFFRIFLEAYQQKYPGRTTFNYVAWLDRITSDEG